VVYYAAHDTELPLVLRLMALCIAAYAFSPIDLIPDFIPVLGLLDDLIIIPAGLALVVRLAPSVVIDRARHSAAKALDKPVSYFGALFVLVCWLAMLLIGLHMLSGA